MEGTNLYPAGIRMLKGAPSPSAAHSAARSFSEMRAQTALFTIVCILIFLIVVFAVLTVREYAAAFGIHCCQPRRRREAIRRANEAMDVRRNDGDDATTALRLQLKRLERKSWYEYYLKKFTHTVVESDFIEEDLEMQGETPCDASKCLSVVCNNGSKKVVDGSCSICICDYEVGDKIVRSPLEQCPHVYHHDCLMQWLAKGKKRCPTCRHWFVPGMKISDQILAEFGDASSSVESTERDDEAVELPVGDDSV